MGVPGLWDVLRPTGQVRALAHLAVEDGFVANPCGRRAYRIGIDASIWFFHALGGREGENPELRTLFFRCARLLAMPYLPIFVFDGPGRPKIKRGKAVGGKEHWLVNSLRSVLDAFGFECRTAPGEAEAELAFLNRVGVIDAVLSDDVDCLIFGAHTVMRNGSITLSGNRPNATGDAQHVYVYHSQDIVTHPDVSLSQGGLILIALLRGGDYDPNGVSGCGVNTAHALAHAGFGDTLLSAALTGAAALATFLPKWRAELREELRTNASGFAQRKCPALAKQITDAFPSLDVLRCYTHPLTTERETGDLASYGLGNLWEHQADVGKIAHVCELFFEWGIEEVVVKRFRTVIWPGAILRALLQSALDRDARAGNASSPQDGGPETPSKALARSLDGIALNESSEFDDLTDNHDHMDYSRLGAAALIKTIHSTRRHASTHNLLEYRVEVRPRALVARTRAGMQGLRVINQDSAKNPECENEGEDEDDEDGTSGRVTTDPDSTLRMWMPAAVVEYACPQLVAAFEGRQAKKAAKKAEKGPRKARGRPREKVTEEDENHNPPVHDSVKMNANNPLKVKGKKTKPRNESQDSVGSEKEIVSPKAAKARKLKAKADKGHIPKTHVASHAGTGSKSILDALDDDPFIVSTGLSPTRLKIHPELVASTISAFRKPCPFPVSPNGDTDSSGLPRPPARACKHSASASSSDADTIKKSPRKSAGHNSPRKPLHLGSPARGSSPSPMRPLQRARMKPLQPAESSRPKHHEEVIVILSDSDSSPLPLRAPLKLPTSAPDPGRSAGVIYPSDLNLNLEEDIIDLT